MDTELNVNHMVKFRLTELGEAIRKESAYGNATFTNVEGNLYRAQLWVFMSVFGNCFWNGAKNVIDGNVLYIPTNDKI